MSGLFDKFQKCYDFLKKEFEDHELNNVIEYFTNNFTLDDLKTKTSDYIFEQLYEEWVSKGNALDNEIKNKKLITSKILVTKYSLKALRKYNGFVTKNNLHGFMPVIIFDSKRKTMVLKKFADLCLKGIDMAKVKTEKDLILGLKDNFKSLLFGGEIEALFYHFKQNKLMNKLFEEENFNEMINTISTIVKGDNKIGKRNKDLDDTGENDPKRPKK